MFTEPDTSHCEILSCTFHPDILSSDLPLIENETLTYDCEIAGSISYTCTVRNAVSKITEIEEVNNGCVNNGTVFCCERTCLTL